MKKIILSFGLFLAVIALNAQSNRLVLLEHFTGANCGPCALYNPAVQDMLEANPDKFIALKYQVDIPTADIMYNQNPGEVDARRSYYGVTSAPYSQIDGNHFSGHPADWNMGTINTRQAVMPPVDIEINAELLPGFEEVAVEVIVTATEDLSGSLVGQIAIVEEHIHFDSPPGSNGETDFYDVMKKMLPNANGTSIPNLLQGESFTINESWTLANVYDFFTLGVVAFVQNNSTKEILQAAKGKPTATADVALDAATFSVKNVSPSVCDGTVTPVINIRNYGGDELYTVGVSYSVNGGSPENYVWEGSLPFFEDVDIELPPLTDVSLNATNMLTVSTFNPNGGMDQNMMNDEATQNFFFNTSAYNNAHVLWEGTQLELYILTDNYPGETTWDVVNSAGIVIAAGGPYADQATEYTEYINMPLGSDCYQFTIYDVFGDGLCCHATYGSGDYRLTNLSTNEIITMNGGDVDFDEEASAIIAEGCAEAPFTENIHHTNDDYAVGSISINLTGINGPYDLQWNNGATGTYIGELAGGDYTVTITDGSGCETIRTFTVDNAITGINDDPNAPALVQNHPNPCNDFTNIQLLRVSEELNLNVVDIAGKIVFQQILAPGTQNVRLNTAQLANGTYFYQLSNANKVLSTKKMVVIH